MYLSLIRLNSQFILPAHILSEVLGEEGEREGEREREREPGTEKATTGIITCIQWSSQVPVKRESGKEERKTCPLMNEQVAKCICLSLCFSVIEVPSFNFLTAQVHSTPTQCPEVRQSFVGETDIAEHVLYMLSIMDIYSLMDSFALSSLFLFQLSPLALPRDSWVLFPSFLLITSLAALFFSLSGPVLYFTNDLKSSASSPLFHHSTTESKNTMNTHTHTHTHTHHYNFLTSDRFYPRQCSLFPLFTLYPL